MNRWAIGLLLVLLACIPILTHRETGAHLLQDTDTKVLLETIRKEKAPFSWFVRDWPLKNHFYRPIPTLSFEMDNRLYGDNPAGYGLTNALLCIGSVLALFWFMRELTDDVALSAGGAILFALWNARGAGWLGPALAYSSWALLVLMLLPGRRPVPAVLAWLGAWFLAGEATGLRDLEHKVLDWLPGRTASVMTLFALLALACYCRYERTSATRVAAPDPGPLDPPATKGTAATRRSGKVALLWAVGSTLFLILALASYEQAVMLPAVLSGVALYLRLSGIRVRWGWVAAFWIVLGGYIWLRSSIIGWATSGYEAQAFHSGGASSVAFALSEYVMPDLKWVWTYLSSIEWNLSLLFIPQFYQMLLAVASAGAAAAITARGWMLPLVGLSLSVLAFLPMAWLQPSDFHHYHYWPMAMRAVFVVAFAKVLGSWIVSAASRPAIQAPLRLDPARGSLPRP